MKDKTHSYHSFRNFGLRYKVALVFGIPVLLIALFLSFNYYSGEKRALEEQARRNAIQLGDVILASLKHGMLVHDQTLISSVLSGASQHENINRIWILDPGGTVRISSLPGEAQKNINTQSAGCIECHKYPSESMPRAKKTENDKSTIRVVTPIQNVDECQACHPASETLLGVLLIDASITDVETQLVSHLQRNLLMTLLVTVMGILIALEMANLLVIRRIEVMHRAMSDFENGDFSVRISQNWRTTDEFTRLADTFNNMVASIARHREEQQKINQVRQQAIMDERERIARELHDGVAQFLGYVSTKIMAIRKLLDKNEIQAAQKQIDQITQAVQDQSADVRASIIGLKLAETSGEELSASLREYVRQCNLLMDLPIELIIEPQAEKVKLNPEVELHLVRIVQEAISNIRKHAYAKLAEVKLSIADDDLVLTIRDDGVGFNPWQWNKSRQPHFGLQSMRERAELVSADFSLVSKPGAGTTVTVKLHLESS
jgi:signal transduction histidine kinase